MKPSLVGGHMLSSLEITETEISEYFPSQQQIARKVGTIKEKLKKESQTD